MSSNVGNEHSKSHVDREDLLECHLFPFKPLYSKILGGTGLGLDERWESQDRNSHEIPSIPSAPKLFVLCLHSKLLSVPQLLAITAVIPVPPVLPSLLLAGAACLSFPGHKPFLCELRP